MAVKENSVLSYHLATSCNWIKNVLARNYLGIMDAAGINPHNSVARLMQSTVTNYEQVSPEDP